KKGILVGMVLGIILGIGGFAFISPPPNSGASGTLTTAGSTTVYQLSQQWAVYFGVDNPGLSVSPSSGGSGVGQSLIAQALIDVGATSSFPKEEFILENPQVEILPISADALGIIANPAVNGTVLRMDCDMVVAIFQRNVTTWEEFEETFDVEIQQTGPISVYARSDASGTTATFAKWLETAAENINNNGAEFDWLLGHEEAISFPSGIQAVDGNPSVASGVENDEHAIGYVGLAFLEDFVTVQLFNPGNNEWVVPSIDNALKAIPSNLTNPGQNLMNSELEGAYPIARLLFYMVNTENLKWYTINYVTWCLIQGQRYVSEVGYVPIANTAAQYYSLSVIAMLQSTP
ncbi:MAG: PstS family phosphate ABC transporter substrate-binding protein, partial [Candidatus Thorarchaeota archaeon]